MAENLSWRGLDLGKPEITRVEEWEAFRQAEREIRGYPLPPYEVFGEFRPEVVKRWFVSLFNFGDPEAPAPFGGPLLYLHYYAIIGFDPGIAYELKNMENSGFSRATAIDIFSLAFMRSTATGLFSQEFIRERLREYKEPDAPSTWPDGWAADPEFWDAGVDFSSPKMQAGEGELIADWWAEKAGEVPSFVAYLGRFRPDYLKTFQARLANVFHATPPQALPYLLLHYKTILGNESGIREAVQMAKGFGLTRTQTIDATVWATLYTSADGLSAVWRSSGDLLETW